MVIDNLVFNRPPLAFECAARWYLTHVRDYLASGKPMQNHLREGRDENKESKSVLIISDGHTLAQLVDDGLISKKQWKESLGGSYPEIRSNEDFISFMKRMSYPVHGASDFIEFLKMTEKEHHLDGAILHDGHEGWLLQAGMIPLPHAIVEDLDMLDYVPYDFVKLDGSIPPKDSNVGGKTQVAVYLPLIYEGIYTVEVRQTAIGNTKFGPVHGFGHGLKDRIRLHVDYHSNGPFLNEEQGVIAIYERFEKANPDERPQVAYKGIVSLEPGSLKYNNIVSTGIFEHEKPQGKSSFLNA